MRAHVIVDGKVVNTIAVNSLSDAEALGLHLVDGESQGAMGDTFADGVFTPPVITKDRQEMVEDVVALCDAIYAKPMLYAEEYKLREAEALAYKTAGYTGEAPRVLAFADAKGMTLNSAVDLTLAQAAALRGALPVIGDCRMSKSYYVRQDISDTQANTKYQTVMVTLRTIQSQLA